MMAKIGLRHIKCKYKTFSVNIQAIRRWKTVLDYEEYYFPGCYALWLLLGPMF
jgi:hypothetical protein